MFLRGLPCLILFAPLALLAEEPEAQTVSLNEIKSAILKGLPIVEKAADNYPKHRKCFSCHHQTLPLQAMVSAADAGFPLNQKVLDGQREHTQAFFKRQKKTLRGTGHLGGRGGTATYALWAMWLTQDEPDELSGDLVNYLLTRQGQRGFWQIPTGRPPMGESRLMATTLGIQGLQTMAQPDQEADAKKAIAKAEQFLLTGPQKVHEDRVAYLWGLVLLNRPAAEVEKARQALLSAQKADGGWSQIPEMESDAYATGQTLFVLHESGLPATHEAMKMGVGFLVKTQQPDGSWFVKTRAKPVQVFFDNGDPHGKSQFISVAASSWAVTALAVNLPASDEAKPSAK